MNPSIVGAYYLENGVVKPVSCSKKVMANGLVVYEVIRIIKGIPLFFSEHFNRLTNSLLLVGIPLELNEFAFKAEIQRLTTINRFAIGNVMIQILQGDEQLTVRFHFIPYQYPTPEAYIKGVKIGLLKADRALPNAKVIQPEVRELANRKIKKEQLFEVVLVDKTDRLTEGSRTNIFLIKSEKLVCVPLKKVLKGITLIKVLELAQKLKIEVEFRDVLTNELSDFDAAFLSGTSPKILPIRTIDSLAFDTGNRVMAKLMEEYEFLISQNVNR